jgi:hypothetical protein
MISPFRILISVVFWDFPEFLVFGKFRPPWSSVPQKKCGNAHAPIHAIA